LALNPGGFLLVKLDGQGGLIDGSNLHSSFHPGTAGGALYLTRVANNHTNVLDYLRWSGLAQGRSHGHFPDGSPHDDRDFATPTPGASNSLAVPLLPVVINEWLASNSLIPDPAGGPNSQEFDDWFELFNPNATGVNLADYFLSDSLTNLAKFRIPAGYAVPAHGYLLVWADSQPKQNNVTNAGLHVDFKLSAGGEAIALFAPDGTLVDAITFGPQVADVSEGRPSDGAAGPFVRFPHPSPGGANFTVTPPIAPALALLPLDPDSHPVLQWSIEPGRTYQLRSRDSLDAPWENLGAPVKANGATANLSDTRPWMTTRFYQVLVVE
jgi:hypothetical protein